MIITNQCLATSQVVLTNVCLRSLFLVGISLLAGGLLEITRNLYLIHK